MLQTTVNGSYNLLLHLQNTVVVALQPAVLFPCSFCLPQLSYSLSVLRAFRALRTGRRCLGELGRLRPETRNTLAGRNAARWVGWELVEDRRLGSENKRGRFHPHEQQRPASQPAADFSHKRENTRVDI